MVINSFLIIPFSIGKTRELFQGDWQWWGGGGRENLCSVKMSSLSVFHIWNQSFKLLPFWRKNHHPAWLKGSGFPAPYCRAEHGRSLTSQLWCPSLDTAPWVSVHVVPSLFLGQAGLKPGNRGELRLCLSESLGPPGKWNTEYCDYFIPSLMDFTSHHLILEAKTLIRKLDKVFLQVLIFLKSGTSDFHLSPVHIISCSSWYMYYYQDALNTWQF